MKRDISASCWSLTLYTPYEYSVRSIIKNWNLQPSRPLFFIVLFVTCHPLSDLQPSTCLFSHAFSSLYILRFPFLRFPMVLTTVRFNTQTVYSLVSTRKVNSIFYFNSFSLSPRGDNMYISDFRDVTNMRASVYVSQFQRVLNVLSLNYRNERCYSCRGWKSFGWKSNFLYKCYCWYGNM